MKLKNLLLDEAIKTYLNGNSIKETHEIIRKKYGIKIHPETIARKFRKLKITRENSEAQKISHRKHLHIQEIIKLYTEDKLSARKIAKIFHSRKETIRKILEENKIGIRNERERFDLTRKYKRKAFSKNQEEKAYLIGLVKGDITAYKKSKYTLGLITNTTVDSFIELFKLAFSKYGHVAVRFNKKINEKQVSIYLNFEDFDFLLHCKQSNEFLNDFDDKEFLYFVSGFIDSDGSVMIKKAGKYLQYVIRIYNEDLQLLNAIQNRLSKLGFIAYVHSFGKKGEVRNYNGKLIVYNQDYYALEISNRKDVSNLLKELSIKHREKANKAIQIREQIQEERIMK